ncbi:hypothetical protein IFM89_022317 [Coptis chinensis]|uniref:Sugar phosphate transporter domain-containing protein n=1 Tax=Coptis chinensis TaxID=261450 RepID=A0A835M4H0_9MAGN|nr:hypothetical protein IFM89_022317 [Coptis chinensis]
MPQGALVDTPDPVLIVERGGFTSREQNGVIDQLSSPARRDIVNRSLSAVKSFGNDDVDLEGGKEEKDIDKAVRGTRVVKVRNQAVLSGLAYCISSCSMILINKLVLSSYNFNAGISLMLYQNLVSVVIVSILSLFGVISTEPLTWRLIRVWLPVNFIFVGMLITSMFRSSCQEDVTLTLHWRATLTLEQREVVFKPSVVFLKCVQLRIVLVRLADILKEVQVVFPCKLNVILAIFSLKYINVAMVTVLKNVTNVITALGEMYLFSKHHESRVWAALFLMIISAIFGGVTDLSFHAVGYTWQIINCFLTASYSLTLRRVMDTAKQVTKSGNLNEFSMVLLNNTLSLPLGILLVLVFNEVNYLSETPLLRMPTFWLVMTASGFLGLAISFTSMWFLHETGATTYSLVGSLNKIPLSIAGILLFKVPTSLENFTSILFGEFS